MGHYNVVVEDDEDASWQYFTLPLPHSAVNKWVGMGARVLSVNQYGGHVKRVGLGSTG